MKILQVGAAAVLCLIITVAISYVLLQLVAGEDSHYAQFESNLDQNSVSASEMKTSPRPAPRPEIDIEGAHWVYPSVFPLNCDDEPYCDVSPSEMHDQDIPLITAERLREEREALEAMLQDDVP